MQYTGILYLSILLVFLAISSSLYFDSFSSSTSSASTNTLTCFNTTTPSNLTFVSPSSSPSSPPSSSSSSYPSSSTTSKMSAISELVKKYIADNIVMVFSKSYCPYCAKAKRVLSQYSLKSYQVIELDQMSNGQEIQAELGKLTGASSVPRVFIGSKFVGGGDDTERLHNEGKLKLLLKEAGALA